MTNGRWQLAHGRSLEFGAEALVMGILNVTPDSFADGGRYFSTEKALAQAERMSREGAAIIDVGGESTRPGARTITAREEQARILPVIEALASGETIISVDTYRTETARLAIEKGAHIVNDVWGAQREPDIARVAAETGAGLLLMHTGRERLKEPDVVAEVEERDVRRVRGGAGSHRHAGDDLAVGRLLEAGDEVGVRADGLAQVAAGVARAADLRAGGFQAEDAAAEPK